ncbi:hypothetical protein ACJRO7_027346 [Eucalyptus globulus]|uniref:Uncharacterized protein n=1 Tax=Eucalyptus globulus TaxID=34317 RepID=A0ABD3JR02_EUCGL
MNNFPRKVEKSATDEAQAGLDISKQAQYKFISSRWLNIKDMSDQVQNIHVHSVSPAENTRWKTGQKLHRVCQQDLKSKPITGGIVDHYL